MTYLLGFGKLAWNYSGFPLQLHQAPNHSPSHLLANLIGDKVF
jgi:hypothetical protein